MVIKECIESVDMDSERAAEILEKALWEDIRKDYSKLKKSVSNRGKNISDISKDSDLLEEEKELKNSLKEKMAVYKEEFGDFDLQDIEK